MSWGRASSRSGMWSRKAAAIDPAVNPISSACGVRTRPGAMALKRTPSGPKSTAKVRIISAEGGIFETIAGRYSGGVPNLDVWLKGHAGDTLRVDRKGRPTEYVRSPAMTLLLTVQYFVLLPPFAHLAKRAAKRERLGWNATPPERGDALKRQY